MQTHQMSGSLLDKLLKTDFYFYGHLEAAEQTVNFTVTYYHLTNQITNILSKSCPFKWSAGMEQHQHSFYILFLPPDESPIYTPSQQLPCASGNDAVRVNSNNKVA